MGSAQVDERFGFPSVADTHSDPFPPGLDPATVRLPSVPRLRTAEDDVARHRRYWRAHVWAALRRYRVAFKDPACPRTLRADYGRVADEARRLLDRATGTYPLRPIDSVGCHAALRELTAGSAALERTMVALRGAPDVRSADPPAKDPGRVSTPADAADTAPGVSEAGSSRVPSADSSPAAVSLPGVTGQDFFAPSGPSRGLDLRLSLRGTRGLRRGRALAEGRPGDDPVMDPPVVGDPTTVHP